jgi:transposase
MARPPAEVEATLRRTDLRPRVRERLEMVKAAALGYDLAEIAVWGGRSLRTVRHWPGRFEAGGLAAVADAPPAGRPARADATYMPAPEAVVDAGPQAVGSEFDVWTSER